MGNNDKISNSWSSGSLYTGDNDDISNSTIKGNTRMGSDDTVSDSTIDLLNLKGKTGAPKLLLLI